MALYLFGALLRPRGLNSSALLPDDVIASELSPVIGVWIRDELLLDTDALLLYKWPDFERLDAFINERPLTSG